MRNTRLRFGLGYPVSLNADAEIVSGMLATSYVAGRDGVLAQLGGVASGAGNTGSINPWTGALVPSGGIHRYDLALPGVGVLPMLHAQGARTNLSNSGALDSSAGGTQSTITSAFGRDARRLTEDTSTGIHRLYGSGSIFISGTTYTTTVYARRAVGARGIRILHEAPDRWGADIDLATGAVSTAGIATGTGFITSATAVSAGDGWWKITIVGGPGANATSVHTVSLRMTGAGAAYTGDGTSAIEVTAAQVEQASFPGIHIPTAGAAVSRTADSYVWTPPGGLIAGEILSVQRSYLWGADDMPGTDAYWWYGSTFSDPRVQKYGADAIAVLRNGAGAQQVITMGPTTRVEGVPVVESLYWEATKGRAYRNGVQVGAEVTAATAPFENTDTQLSFGGPSASHALQALMYKPGGYTATERASFQRLLPSMIQAVA